MIRHLNPDFWINLDSDPDVCRITPKMLWICYVFSVSQFAECHENQLVTVWEMPINRLKSSIPQWWGKWSRICIWDPITTNSRSVLPIGKPNHKHQVSMKSTDCICSNLAQKMTERQTNWDDGITSVLVEVMKIAAMLISTWTSGLQTFHAWHLVKITSRNTQLLCTPLMALNNLICAHVLLRNYSRTRDYYSHLINSHNST